MREAPPPSGTANSLGARAVPPPQGASGSEERAAPPQEEEQEEAGEGSEPANFRATRSPDDPTPQEIEDHAAAGHSPYRAWCRACVAGAGRRERHIRQNDTEHKAAPTLSVDYAFMGGKTATREGAAGDMPIMVTKCEADRWVTADVVPAKGATNRYGAQILAEIIVHTGVPKLILKSDGGPAINEMNREAVKRAREEVNMEVIFEESHAYVSETAGLVEQAIRQVEERTRTLRFATEEMHGTKLEPDSPILP